jgi:hypothetical protein
MGAASGHRSDACSYSRPNQEALFSHAVDAISVLVGENQEHLCEDHPGSHNGSVARIGTNPQKLARVRQRIRVRLTIFCGIGNRTF